MTMPEPTAGTALGRRATLLVAKSAITGAAHEEMATLAAALQAEVHEPVAFAFTEQGDPPLRSVVRAQVAGGADELLILPLLMPMEPGLRVWLTRSLQRWRDEWLHEAEGRGWPRVRIAPQPAGASACTLLRDMHGQAAAMAEALPERAPAPEGSLVPAQKYRVLVCQGGPCNNAGSGSVWGHLRNEQKRLNLRTTGGGTMSAKTSCLGPCNLAPVVQVFPEGTWYGGVDEAGIDRIIAEHLLEGRPVEALAYAPLAAKQRLRGGA